MIDFSGSCVLVTGGSRGIGRSVVRMFAASGAKVSFTYHKDKKAAEFVRKTVPPACEEAIPIQCNAQNYRDCERAVNKAISIMKRIDILVNAAGVWEMSPIGQVGTENWNRSIEVNLTGTFNFCNAVVPLMRKQKFGRIINVSSTAGQRGESSYSAYAASKAGVIGFTKSIAVELIRDGIRVNCIAPGWVETDMTASVMKNPRKKREIIASIPRGRIASPDEIAGPILFLASSLSENIVGEILNANGGSVLCG